jgi:hypothetical protein
MLTIPSRAPSPRNPAIADSLAHPFEQMLDFRTFVSLRHMASRQQEKRLLRRADFLHQLTLYLPEVASRIEDSDFGIVHLEVGAMKMCTREAILRHDFATARRHFFLIADLMERADAELSAAIRISYLEALFLKETASVYAQARAMLPRPMENALRQSELRLRKMSAALA